MIYARGYLKNSSSNPYRDSRSPSSKRHPNLLSYSPSPIPRTIRLSSTLTISRRTTRRNRRCSRRRSPGCTRGRSRSRRITRPRLRLRRSDSHRIRVDRVGCCTGPPTIVDMERTGRALVAVVACYSDVALMGCELAIALLVVSGWAHCFAPFSSMLIVDGAWTTVTLSPLGRSQVLTESAQARAYVVVSDC